MTEEKTNFEDVYDTSSIDKQLEKNQELIEAIEDGDFFDFTAEDYNSWYNEQREIAEKEFSDFEQQKHRTFDDIINKFKILIGLTGESYNDTTKVIFYSVIANQLKHNYFTMDSKKIDLRLNVLLQLKAGHGKKNYEYFIRRTIEGLGKRYQEPTSYHPEQFVGKIVTNEYKGETIYTPVLGTLAADFLVMDEAHALLTRKENEECLRYIRTALDPIGDNRVEKKQVNVPDSEKLQYCPDCSIMLLTQPITNIDENLLLRGSFRRFIVVVVNTTFDERINARRNALFLSLKEDVHNRIWERWIELNKNLQKYKNLKYITSGNLGKIDDYLDDVGKESSMRSKEVLEYYNTSQFSIKQNIFKMILIRAIVEHKQENGDTITIQDSHITAGIKDWHLIWRPQIEWIAQQLIINAGLPLTWDEKVHGYIINILSENQNIRLKDLMDIFHENNLFTGTEKNVKRKAYRAIDQLEVWGFIRRDVVENTIIIRFLKNPIEIRKKDKKTEKSEVKE